MKNVYKTYIDVIGYTKSDKARYANDAQKDPVEDEQMEDETME